MKRPPNRHERKCRAIQRERSANRVRANAERKRLWHRRFSEAMRPAQELWAKLFADPRNEQLIGSLRLGVDEAQKQPGQPTFMEVIERHRRKMAEAVGVPSWTISGENTNPDDPGRLYARILDPFRSPAR